MKNLVTIVVPRIAAEWNTVAYYMDFEIAEIKTIREKCREDPEKCCTELLERWLQMGSDRSWATLLTVFKQVRNLTAVTEKIENDLQNLQLYVDYLLYSVFINFNLHFRGVSPSALTTKKGTSCILLTLCMHIHTYLHNKILCDLAYVRPRQVAILIAIVMSSLPSSLCTYFTIMQLSK